MHTYRLLVCSFLCDFSVPLFYDVLFARTVYALSLPITVLLLQVLVNSSGERYGQRSI